MDVWFRDFGLDFACYSQGWVYTNCNMAIEECLRKDTTCAVERQHLISERNAGAGMLLPETVVLGSRMSNMSSSTSLSP
jgi:hypothetical protein